MENYENLWKKMRKVVQRYFLLDHLDQHQHKHSFDFQSLDDHI